MSTEDELSRAEAVAAEGMQFMRTQASTWSPRLTLALGLLAIMLVAVTGAWLDHMLTPQPIKEDVQAAPMERLSASAVVAATDPLESDAPPPAPSLPRAAVRQRAARIVARPAPGASSVEIDTDLTREGDKLKLHVTSPDGTIDSAVDYPITPALLSPEPKKWATGIGYTTEREVGIWIERDVGRLRLGAELLKGQGRPRAELRAGISF